MEHLILKFEHDIRDLVPYCEFVHAVRPMLAQKNLGEYLGDDMAIDGGDAEATFAAPDVLSLYPWCARMNANFWLLQTVQLCYLTDFPANAPDPEWLAATHAAENC